MVRMVQARLYSLRDAVIARRMLWALCLHCGHAERFDPRSLAFEFGALDFVQIEHMLKCKRCGAKGRAAIVPNDQEWPDR